jgi:putative oxidoreductase
MLVGFLARPAAIGILAVMLVAIAKVHGKHGFFINFANTPGKGHGFEFNLVLIAMALSILIGGAGALSIDRLIAPWGPS